MRRLKLLVPNVIQYNKVELMKLILTGVTVVCHDSDISILKEVIAAESVNTFKNRLDKWRKG